MFVLFQLNELTIMWNKLELKYQIRIRNIILLQLVKIGILFMLSLLDD